MIDIVRLFFLVALIHPENRCGSPNNWIVRSATLSVEVGPVCWASNGDSWWRSNTWTRWEIRATYCQRDGRIRITSFGNAYTSTVTMLTGKVPEH